MFSLVAISSGKRESRHILVPCLGPKLFPVFADSGDGSGIKLLPSFADLRGKSDLERGVFVTVYKPCSRAAHVRAMSAGLPSGCGDVSWTGGGCRPSISRGWATVGREHPVPL